MRRNKQESKKNWKLLKKMRDRGFCMKKNKKGLLRRRLRLKMRGKEFCTKRRNRSLKKEKLKRRL